MAAPQAPTRSRPDWYTDPGDSRLIRYWDGSEWSVHTLPKPPGWDQRSTPANLPWWQRWWAVGTALVIFAPAGLIGLWRRPGLSTRLRVSISVLSLLFFGAVVLSNGDEPPSQQAVAPATTSKGGGSGSTEPTPAADVKAAKPKPRKSKVPPVTGLAGAQAKRKLATAGLVAFVAREIPSARPRGTVLRQLRAVGASVREGSSVGLVIAAPYPTVPGTAGMAQAAAIQRLRSAGFQVRVTKEVVTAGREGVVLRQTPIGSRLARPHSVVTVVVAHVVRPVVAPPPPSNCTPGYSPCLPPAYDYDCAGGSGDGPKYTGLVRVTGYDIYDLDRDGDGYGCD